MTLELSPNSECRISAIIPVYNGGPEFRRCLKSLTGAMPPPHEVIVVADGDSDGSWQLAEEFSVTVIRISTSGGPAKARNLGAREARCDILFFVDADVEIHSDTIRKVAQAFHQEPDLSALIGSYDDKPGASNFLSQYKNLFHHYTHQTASSEASTFWGACGAIRRDIFLALEGFDEAYRLPCVEDIELGYRLRQAGYRIKLDKTLQVKHLKRWGLLSLLKADFFYRALPWTALLLRDRQLSNDLNLKWSSRLSVMLLYALLVGLVVSWWWSWGLLATCVFGLLLVTINAPVYQFFHNKKGLGFSIQTIPWHWLYYFYSGLAFAIGIARHLLEQSFRKKRDVRN